VLSPRDLSPRRATPAGPYTSAAAWLPTHPHTHRTAPSTTPRRRCHLPAHASLPRTHPAVLSASTVAACYGSLVPPPPPPPRPVTVADEAASAATALRPHRAPWSSPLPPPTAYMHRCRRHTADPLTADDSRRFRRRRRRTHYIRTATATSTQPTV